MNPWKMQTDLQWQEADQQSPVREMYMAAVESRGRWEGGVTKAHKESFEGYGNVHCIDCGDGFEV